ncbi:hypothetical protein CPB86DRAFT_748915 [Serendipita vermifera]|nr:hypothetical protein CPB86DRAFT_748915 [Serendipita vermifera]
MLLASRRFRQTLVRRTSQANTREYTFINGEDPLSSHNNAFNELSNLKSKSATKPTRAKPVSFASQWPDWDIRVGIEVHAQLKTREKLFSKSSTQSSSEESLNECVSLFDAAFPGTLPTLNTVCVTLAARTALALHANIQTHSSFDRKHYFYGDLPTGYQITQNYAPFARNGYLKLMSSEKKVRIKQIQIEQDTAKSLAGDQRVSHDLNRTGMPLLEIVSLPDICSPEEAGDYVRTLQAILRSIGVSDGMMEMGSLRCDVNVSVNRRGEPFGTRTELKNLNSIRNVTLATYAEATRQVKLLTSGSGVVLQETLTFDEDTLTTHPLRSKEGIEDYRYMPDPNLPIITLDRINVDKVGEEMKSQAMTGPSEEGTEYGWEGIKRRLKQTLDIRDSPNVVHESKALEAIKRDLGVLMLLDAGNIVGWDGVVNSGAIAFFEEVVGSRHKVSSPVKPKRNPKVVLNWMIHELLGQLTLRNETFAQNPITAQQFGEIIDAVEEGRITGSGGKILLRHLLAAKRASGINISDNLISKSNTRPEVADLPSIPPFSVSDLIVELGLTKTSSISDLDRWCDQAISEMLVEVEKYKSGKKTVIMALVGKVMKLSKGTADAIRSKEILESKLGDADKGH